MRTITEIVKVSFLIIYFTVSFQLTYGQILDDMFSQLCRLHQKLGLTDIEINYSRPSLKGRLLFGDLIAEGKINGQKLKPGIYAIYTIPSKDEWEIIFNKDVYRDPYEGRLKEADVLRLLVPSIQTDLPVETFTILISDISKDLISASIDLAWGLILIKLPVEVPNKWDKQ